MRPFLKIACVTQKPGGRSVPLWHMAIQAAPVPSPFSPEGTGAPHHRRTTERTRSGGRHGRATANPQGRPCGRTGAQARTPEQRPRAAAAQGGRSGPNSGRAHLFLRSGRRRPPPHHRRATPPGPPTQEHRAPSHGRRPEGAHHRRKAGGRGRLVSVCVVIFPLTAGGGAPLRRMGEGRPGASDRTRTAAPQRATGPPAGGFSAPAPFPMDSRFPRPLRTSPTCIPRWPVPPSPGLRL